MIYFEVYFLPSTIISESGAYSDIATLRSRFKSYSSRGTPFSYICKSTTSTGNPYFGITQYFDKYLITLIVDGDEKVLNIEDAENIMVRKNTL